MNPDDPRITFTCDPSWASYSICNSMKINGDIKNICNSSSMIKALLEKKKKNMEKECKELEKKLAAYFNTEDAVYLPSGYLSSLAGLKALDSLYNYDIIWAHSI